MAKLSDIDLSRLATILTDSAYQVNRANPLNGIALHEPCPDWMKAYVETVLAQIDAAVAEDETECGPSASYVGADGQLHPIIPLKS